MEYAWCDPKIAKSKSLINLLQHDVEHNYKMLWCSLLCLWNVPYLDMISHIRKSATRIIKENHLFYQSVQRKSYNFKKVFPSLCWKARVETCIRDALAPIDVQRWLLQGRKQNPLGHVPRCNCFWRFQRLRSIRLHRKYLYSQQMCCKSWFNTPKGLDDTWNATIIIKRFSMQLTFDYSILYIITFG